MPIKIPSVPVQKEAQGTPSSRCISCEQTIAESYAAYLCDESRLPGGRADELIFAYSEAQIVEVLRRAKGTRTSVTLSAARTGIVGGAVPQGGIILSLEFMNRFVDAFPLEADPGWGVRVEPGVSVEKLREILDSGEAGAGSEHTVKMHFEQFRKEKGLWFYPVDPTEKSAHLGGTVATNASGAHSFRYGQTRNHVLALRVVLADGTVLFIPRNRYIFEKGDSVQIEGVNGMIGLTLPSFEVPPVKNTAGYYIRYPLDLIDLFIGSEGTLGVITEVDLALQRKPPCNLAGVAYFPSDDDAIRFVMMSRNEKENPDVAPSALEYFDGYALDMLRKKREEEGVRSSIPSFPDNALAAVYFEQPSNDKDMEKHYMAYDALLKACSSSMDQTWGGMEEAEIDRMALFRHAVPEVVNTLIGQRQKQHPGLHKIGTDFVVPDDRLRDMMGFYRDELNKMGFEYVIFGHIGENHLHVNILPRDESELEKSRELYKKFARKAVEFKGSVSGEHGIGRLKKSLLEIMYPKEMIDQMKALKHALDPDNILNPYALFG